MTVKTLSFKDENSIQTILGMAWDVNSDCFNKFIYKRDDAVQKVGTRRSIRSVYSSIFDPLGLHSGAKCKKINHKS